MLPLVVVLAVMIVTIQPTYQGAPAKNVKRSGLALASKRLMKEFKDVQESDSYNNGVFTVELVDDNIYKWHVKLYKFDMESQLHKSLQQLKEQGGKDHILLEVSYSDNYPFSPPFVRVVYPFLKGHSMMNAGLICSQLLSENGWSSSYTIEPMILHLIATLIEGNGRVNFGVNLIPYTEEAARKHYELFLARDHSGWTMPDKS